MGGFLKGLGNFSGTKVIGVVFIGGSFGGTENLESVKYESGLVDGTFAGGAAMPWSGYGGMPSAWHETMHAAIILIRIEYETALKLILDRCIINASGRSIKSLAPINKLELIIIRSR